MTIWKPNTPASEACDGAMDHANSLDGLLDKAAITDLIHAYCYHFDRGEADNVLALFHKDAVVDYGPDVAVMFGVAEFGPMITKGLAEFFAATSHHISNVAIRFDGENSARSTCYVYAWHRYQDGRPNSELWGQYHHELRRTSDGWKISRLYLCAAGTDNFHRDNMHPIGRQPAMTSNH